MNDQTAKVDPQAVVLRRRRARRIGASVLRIALAVLILAGLGLGIAYWARNTLLYVHETDARISADMVAVSSRVAGWIIARPIGAGSVVGAGDTLAVVDGRDVQARLAELHAELDRIEAERAEVGAEIAMVEERTDSRARVEQAKLDAAQALVDAIDHESSYMQRELERVEQLSSEGVVSAKTLDETRTEYLKTQKELVRARAGLATVHAQLVEVRAERREIAMLERERDTLQFRKIEVLARIERQKLSIADRVVTSPLDGVVSKAFVEVGEYVQPGQRLALIHDPQAVYVEANIRETQIRHVALGQAVRVEVDAFPERTFAGHVERIGQAATSQFALLPSPNPSGNFTKVTQRLPVRISVSQEGDLLRPGMMVEVFIHVGED